MTTAGQLDFSCRGAASEPAQSMADCIRVAAIARAAGPGPLTQFDSVTHGPAGTPSRRVGRHSESTASLSGRVCRAARFWCHGISGSARPGPLRPGPERTGPAGFQVDPVTIKIGALPVPGPDRGLSAGGPPGAGRGPGRPPARARTLPPEALPSPQQPNRRRARSLTPESDGPRPQPRAQCRRLRRARCQCSSSESLALAAA